GAERGAEELGQLGHGPLAVALEQQQGHQLRAWQLAFQGQHVGVEQGRAQPACEDQVQQSIHLPPNITESKYPWAYYFDVEELSRDPANFSTTVTVLGRVGPGGPLPACPTGLNLGAEGREQLEGRRGPSPVQTSGVAWPSSCSAALRARLGRRPANLPSNRGCVLRPRTLFL